MSESNTEWTPPDLGNRHPAILDTLEHFRFDHLPAHLQEVSRPCAVLAYELVATVPDDAQVTQGLWDLLRAKDCFVRAAVKAHRNAGD